MHLFFMVLFLGFQGQGRRACSRKCISWSCGILGQGRILLQSCRPVGRRIVAGNRRFGFVNCSGIGGCMRILCRNGSRCLSQCALRKCFLAGCRRCPRFYWIFCLMLVLLLFVSLIKTVSLFLFLITNLQVNHFTFEF